MEAVKKCLVPFICSLAFSISAGASLSISLQGKIVQIKDGNVEIKNRSGISRVVFKKLPKESQNAVMNAIQQRREILLNVTPEMMTKN